MFNTIHGASAGLRYDRRDFPPTEHSNPQLWTTLGEIADIVRQVREWPSA
ncbi:hypothetical protein [Saccharopolyspora hattusasensis]